MFAKIKLGVAVAGVGWISVVSPAVAHSEPPGNNSTCAGLAGINLAGINYVADPDDANAYYVCADGVTQQHLDCPLPGAALPDIPGPCIRAVPPRLPQGNAHAKP